MNEQTSPSRTTVNPWAIGALVLGLVLVVAGVLQMLFPVVYGLGPMLYYPGAVFLAAAVIIAGVSRR